MVEHGTFQTDRFFEYTAGNDFAYRNGHFFADRPPGTAILAAPWYIFGKLFDSSEEMAFPQQLEIRHMVSVLPAFAGAWCIVLIVRVISRLTNSDPLVPTLVGLYAALGSQLWKFSSHLFSHTLLSALIICLFGRLVELHQRQTLPTRAEATLTFLLIGLLPYFGYEGVLIIPVFVIGFLLRGRELAHVHGLAHADVQRGLVRAFLALSVPLLLLGTYHQLVWGAPWRTFSAFQNPLHFGNLHFSTLLSFPLAQGLWTRFFLVPSKAQDCPIGLFVLQPLLCVGLLGYLQLWKFSKRVTVVHASCMLIYAVFFAKYWDQCGGSSGDPRYMLPMVPMLCVPLGLWLAGPFASWRAGRGKAMAITLLGFAGSLGALMCLVHFSQFHGHDFSFKRDIEHYSLVGADAAQAILSRVFVGSSSLSYMIWALLVLLSCGGVVKLVKWLFGRFPMVHRLADIRIGFALAALTSLTAVYLQYRDQLRIAALPQGSLCMHRAKLASMLPILMETDAAKQAEPMQRLELPLQFEAPVNHSINNSEYYVFSATVDLSQDIPESVLEFELDDELFININGKPVVEIPGVRGRSPFRYVVPLTAGRNEIKIGHVNLGGLGWFSLQHLLPGGQPVPWSCEGKPGFCLKHLVASNALRSPEVLRYILAGSPRSELQLPFDFLLGETEADAFLLWGYYDNPYLTPQKAIVNMLVDDESTLVLNGKRVGFEFTGAQAPRGEKVQLNFPPGRSELLLFYRNSYIAGYFKAGIWFLEDGNPVPLRCSPQDPNPTVDSLPPIESTPSQVG